MKIEFEQKIKDKTELIEKMCNEGLDATKEMIFLALELEIMFEELFKANEITDANMVLDKAVFMCENIVQNDSNYENQRLNARLLRKSAVFYEFIFDYERANFCAEKSQAFWDIIIEEQNALHGDDFFGQILTLMDYYELADSNEVGGRVGEAREEYVDMSYYYERCRNAWGYVVKKAPTIVHVEKYIEIISKCMIACAFTYENDKIQHNRELLVAAEKMLAGLGNTSE